LLPFSPPESLTPLVPNSLASPFLPPTEKKKEGARPKVGTEPSRAHRSPRRRDSFRVSQKSVHFHLNVRNKGSEQKLERGLAKGEGQGLSRQVGTRRPANARRKESARLPKETHASLSPWRQKGFPWGPTTRKVAASHLWNQTVHPTFDKKEPHL
jgi:hypothetical protein